MLNGPFQLLDRNQYLSKQRIDLCLARVKTSYSSDIVLIVKNVSVNELSVTPMLMFSACLIPAHT